MLRPINLNHHFASRTIKICNKPPKRTLPPNSRCKIPQQSKPQLRLGSSHLTPHLLRERNEFAVVGFHNQILSIASLEMNGLGAKATPRRFSVTSLTIEFTFSQLLCGDPLLHRGFPFTVFFCWGGTCFSNNHKT
jgi:hypothetical protein